MNLHNFQAAIVMRRIERSFTYDNTQVLKLKIDYPRVILPQNSYAQRNINRQIRSQVSDFFNYASGDLYKQAVENYKFTKENDFPFHGFDAILQYEITYNEHFYLSLYRDGYEYTGGAHGNTLRASDTWSLNDGQNVPLSDFFAAGEDYRAFLIEEITRQATRNLAENPGIYFENYRELIAKNFDEEQYYLTKDGIAIYYQQYEIAPYSTGIVVFTVPYPDTAA